MPQDRSIPQRPRQIVATVFGLLLLAGAAPSMGNEPASDGGRPQIPDRYKDADAVILRWDQTWEKATDGAVTYREIKHILMQNDRANRTFADPRITYNRAFQTVRVSRATTVLPDGRTIDVPDYARNEVSPRSAGGWPAFADVRERVFSFSGIEPGAILEFEWERSTKPGMHRFLEIECRLHGKHPILNRRIQLPDGKPAREYQNLDAAPDESGAIPWRDAEEFVWHSDCPNEKTWTAGVLEGIEASAKESDAVRSFAVEWSEGKSNPLDKAYEIQTKLKKRLSIVHLPDAHHADRLRGVGKVMAGHYGRPAETTALLLALFRAAGLEAEPFFVVRDEKAGWFRSAITHHGVSIKSPTGTSYWHVSDGRLRDPGPWGGWRRYDTAFATGGANAAPSRFRSPDGSRLSIDVRIKLDDEAKWTADLDITAGGLFVPPGSLRTEDQKKSAVRAILSKVLPEAKLKDFTVTTLSDEVFAVSATAAAKKPLKHLHDGFVFQLPREGPWTQRFGFPLGRSRRETTLRLAGRFMQEISIDIAMPADWTIAAQPASFEHRPQMESLIKQRLEVSDGRLTIHRRIEIGSRDVETVAFGKLRSAINDLQSAHSRTVIFSPAAPTVDAKQPH